MNFSNLDLNLLRVFHQVASEKSVTRAAKNLHVTQPAISHAVARLRHLLADPLFVKARGGIALTPRAERLQPDVARVLAEMEQMFRTGPFDPMRSSRKFTLATTDMVESLMLAQLACQLSTKAPEITFVTRTLSGSFPSHELERGDLDFAIAGYFKDVGPDFMQEDLYSDDFVCLASQSHPRLRKVKSITLKQFCSEKHMMLTITGDTRTTIDDQLERHQMSRKVQFALSYFSTAGVALSQCELILVCPRRLAAQLMKIHRLQVFELPGKLSIPKIQMKIYFHKRLARDPLTEWMLSLLREIF